MIISGPGKSGGFALLTVLVLLLVIMMLGQSSLTVARAAMRESTNDDRMTRVQDRVESLMDAALASPPAIAPLGADQSRCGGALLDCADDALPIKLPGLVANWIEDGTAALRVHRPVRATLPPPATGGWSAVRFQSIALQLDAVAADAEWTQARAAASAGVRVVTAREPPGQQSRVAP